MKNNTRNIFGRLSTWIMVILFIAPAPFAQAQDTPDMVITGFLAADETPGLTNAYPGNVIFATVSGNLNFDFKTTPARYALVNQKCIDTQGQSGLNFPISSVEVTDDGVNKLLKIKATVPHNILKEEYKLQNLKVLCVTSGTVINLGGIFINSNVISENSEAKLYLTGGDKSGSNLNFYKAGPRHFTSPKFNISSITGSTLSYEIRRTEVAAPPEGSEILCEYSTNGETWIKFDTIKLDMGTAWPASVIEKDMIAGMVSANTQFRFRQVEETYAANTHPWEIRNFIVFVPSSNTNFEESAIATFTVNTPTYTVALTAAGPFAVGSNVSVTYSAVNGKFPDKTKFEKILYNWDKSPNDFMHFGTANAPIDAGTVSIPLPFILYDDLAISLRAEGPEGLIHEATTVNFNSQPVSVTINEIVYTEPIEDTGGEATSPGKEIVAKYTINNGTSLGSSIQIALEYYMGSEWFSLNSIVPDASGTGNISGTLPYMPLSSSLPVRVILVDTESLGYRNTTINRSSSSDEVYLHVNAEGSRFGFNVYGEVVVDANAYVEYSTDGGTTWEMLGTKALTTGTEGFLFDYTADLFDVVDADSNPITGWVRFRLNADNHEAVINPEILGHRLEQPFEMPEIKDQQNIRIINPSVTFSDMVIVNQGLVTENDEFEYETGYSIKYTTRGLWPTDTWFAFAFVRNNKHMVLAESNLQGENTLAFTIPSKMELEEYFGVTLSANETFHIETYAYSRDAEFGGYNDLRIFYNPIEITPDDYIEKEWGDLYSSWWIYFDNNGERYAVTKAYNLTTVAEPLFLNFRYYGSIVNKTLNTLPKVQVSIDNGVTYHDLEITQESAPTTLQYYDLNRLEASGMHDYSIAIPKEYQKEAVHFRFKQGTPRPSGTDYWCIYNTTKPNISGASNELGFYDKFSGAQQITLTTGEVDCATYKHSLMAYNVNIVDEDLDPRLTPTPKTGEEFDFEMVYQGSGSSFASNNNYDTHSSDFGDPTPGMYSSCPKSLTVTIPENAIITNVYTYYLLNPNNGADLTQARSRIVCTNNGGVAEGTYYSGVSYNGGTWGFRNDNLNTFNGITGGGDITFELHLFRTWGGSGCNTDYLYINNWRLIVDYTLSPAAFPQGTLYTLALEHTNGDPVLDPETEEPVVLGTYTANETNDTIFGAATIPTFVETGVYNVRAYTQYQNNLELCEWNYVVKEDLLVENEYVADPLQLSLVSPNNADAFMTSDEVDFRYSTYGDWPTDIKMAAVVKAGLGGGQTHYQVIGQSTATGQEVSIADVNMIDAPWYDNNNDAITNYELGIVAYKGNELVLNNKVYGPLEDEDFLVIQGQENEHAVDYWIDQEGNRKLVTKAFDLAGLKDVNLQFYYMASNITPSASTLPQLLITTDGGQTFDTLVVEQSPYGEIGLLQPNGWITYTVPVDDKYLTAATQFKWVQSINQGVNQDQWLIHNIYINSGNSNVFEGFERWVDITLDWPKLGNYTWEIIANEQGLEPTLYNGTTFNFGWTLNVDPITEELMPALPAGTEVEFFLWDAIADDFVLDPANGKPISLGKTTKVDTLQASIPFLLQRENYTVRAFAVLDDVEYDKSNVSTINIYNAVIRPTLVEANPVLFSGNEVEFEATLENTIDPTLFNNTWFNLIMNYDGKDWLMATQQGLTNNFTATIPPFVNGNNNFRIEASDTEAMGEVGDILSSLVNKTLANADFPTWYGGNHNVANNTNGLMGQLVSDTLDLTTFEAVKFKLKIEKPLEELTDDQKMVFSYSIDGGVSFVDIHTYPDTRFVDSVYFDNEDPTNWFNEELTLPAEAITEETILRWRVEESKGFARIDEIQLMAITGDYNQVPVNSINTNVSIRRQRINVTPVSLSACPDATVELDYNIRGRFGDDVIVGVQANPGGIIPGGIINIDGKPLTFEGVTHGTGTVSFNLGLIDNELSGSNVTFHLTIEDETNPDYTYSTGNIDSYYSENGVNILRVNAGSVSLSTNSPLSCAEEERIVTINGVQPYYRYELLNFVTGEVIHAGIIANPDDEVLTTDNTNDDVYPYYNGTNQLYLNIGAISELTRVEVKVTATDAHGLACQTVVPNRVLDLDVRDAYSLFTQEGSIYVPVENNSEFVYCGQSGVARFALGYYDANGNFIYAGAKWLRVRSNESETLITTANPYIPNASSGKYIARFNDGKCGMIEYTFNVVINEQPEQPVITIAGQEMQRHEICYDGEVTLDAPEGYAYYRWTNNSGGLISVVFGNNRSINVENAGAYRVEVSNSPISEGCLSSHSKPVNIVVNNLPNVSFASTTISLCPTGDGVAEVQVNGVQMDYTYHMVNNATMDTVATFAGYSSYQTFNTTPITEDSQFSIYAEHDVNGCTKLVSSNILTIRLLPTYELLAHNGTYYEPALEAYCQGTTLAIGEADGTLASAGTIKWYKDNILIDAGFNTFASEPGIYWAEWELNEDCTYTTEQVTISSNPVRPTITFTGDLEFCEGNGNLELTAPEGFAQYVWIRNNLPLSNIASTANSIVVNQTGDYRVRVINESGCEGEQSSAVKVTVHSKPDNPSFTVIDQVLCEPGVVNVMVNNAQADVYYQIYNTTTGEATGDARLGSNNLILQSDVITETTKFEVRATRAEVDGCYSVTYSNNEIKVYDLYIDVNGNTLTASIPNGEARSYQWYRNDRIINTGGTRRTLNIYDDAEYKVVVETYDDCILESSIGNGPVEDDTEEEAATTLSLFPNPATDIITVNFANAEDDNVRIRILNISGEVVFDKEVEKVNTELRYEIPIHKFSTGAYIVHVIGKQEVKVQQFIKF